MPLRDGYGVVIGTLHRYYPDPPHDYGEYFHANVDVLTPRGVYRCKLDVDGRPGHAVLWRVVDLGPSDLHGLATLPDGWHDLDSTRHSGALDYHRSPELRLNAHQAAVASPATAMRPLASLAHEPPGWRSGTRAEALADLERLLEDQTRLFIFGEPFSRGHGVHNVHQNQGDPLGTEWSAENGVWQDGALVAAGRSGDLVAYLTKYATQAGRTDRHGHPAV